MNWINLTTPAPAPLDTTPDTGNDWLNVILSAPILLLVGVIIKVVYDRITSRDANKTQSRTIQVSETEAETHAFQALIDAMQANMEALERRTTKAEQHAEKVERKADEALSKIDILERQKSEMVAHIVALEGLIPNPPGPPKRPNWV